MYVLHKNSCSWGEGVELRSYQLFNHLWQISKFTKILRGIGQWIAIQLLKIATCKLLAESCSRDWCGQKPLAHSLGALIHLSVGQCGRLFNISTNNKINFCYARYNQKKTLYSNTPQQQQCVQWKFDWHPLSWRPKSIKQAPLKYWPCTLWGT